MGFAQVGPATAQRADAMATIRVIVTDSASIATLYACPCFACACSTAKALSAASNASWMAIAAALASSG
jgi:hypothetical protein